VSLHGICCSRSKQNLGVGFEKVRLIRAEIVGGVKLSIGEWNHDRALEVDCGVTRFSLALEGMSGIFRVQSPLNIGVQRATSEEHPCNSVAYSP
jgi:hypothetical protein